MLCGGTQCRAFALTSKESAALTDTRLCRCATIGLKLENIIEKYRDLHHRYCVKPHGISDSWLVWNV